MAHRLLRAGIQYVQGFSVNVANPSDHQAKLPVGRELSDLLGRRGVRYRHLPQRPRPSSG